MPKYITSIQASILNLSTEYAACVQATIVNCRCIIDCSEIFIKTSKNFDTRVKSHSKYKRHSTVKFLIGITPVETISFLSQCWGGRVSDENLT